MLMPQLIYLWVLSRHSRVFSGTLLVRSKYQMGFASICTCHRGSRMWSDDLICQTISLVRNRLSHHISLTSWLLPTVAIHRRGLASGSDFFWVHGSRHNRTVPFDFLTGCKWLIHGVGDSTCSMIHCFVSVSNLVLTSSFMERGIFLDRTCTGVMDSSISRSYSPGKHPIPLNTLSYSARMFSSGSSATMWTESLTVMRLRPTHAFRDSRLCCFVSITKKFSVCLQFMLSVTVIVHQPSGIIKASPYIVIACVDSVSRGLPILAKSRHVSMLHVAAVSSWNSRFFNLAVRYCYCRDHLPVIFCDAVCWFIWWIVTLIPWMLH